MNQNIEQKIIELIEGTANQLGLEIISVKLKGSPPNILEISIDRLDMQRVTVTDCRSISRSISAILDVEDIIENKYYLEVSSAGIERPLIKFSDYIRFKGREAKIKLTAPINDCRKYQGLLVDAKDEQIFIETGEGSVVIPFASIKSARLLLTDKMFKEILSKSNENI